MTKGVIARSLMLTISLAACGRPSATPPTQRAVLSAILPVDTSPAERDDALFILFEYSAGLRELALAEAVLARTRDPAIRSLATVVRDGHQLGLSTMRRPAAELGLTLPRHTTPSDRNMINAALALPPDRLDGYFLRRQRALHAWDIASFDDYGAVASNPRLKAYVAATLEPLRNHAALVDGIAKTKGVAMGPPR